MSGNALCYSLQDAIDASEAKSEEVERGMEITIGRCVGGHIKPLHTRKMYTHGSIGWQRLGCCSDGDRNMYFVFVCSLSLYDFTLAI